MNRRFSTLALATLLTVLGGAAAGSAQAQTERPFYVGGGAGAAIELDTYPSQAMLVQEFGWHFLGTTDGPFIALSLAESFGSDVFTFQIAPRFGYDISLLRGPDIGVLLAPSVAPGFVVAAVSANTPYGRVSGSDAAFDLQVAAEVKLLLVDDQLEIFFRPVSFDLFVDDGGTAARWNVLAGASFRF